MTILIKKFYQSASWNAFESIFYKAILTIHQTCLFYIATNFIYGLSSFIFAIIYLAVELGNLGLDRSIAQFSQAYLNDDRIFKRYLMPQILIQICFLLGLVLLALKYNWISLILKPAHATLSIAQIVLILVIIICESLRKTLRIVSQLLFLNKPAALLELSLILLYTGLFWCSVFAGYEISIYTIYTPLLIQSIIGIFFLTYLIIAQLRSTLLKSKAPKSKPEELNYLAIFKYRSQNYLYQLSEVLFSSNFLIYFFSNIIGIINIGPIKLANYFAVFLKALLDKTFGLTCLALFAKNKTLISNQAIIFNYAQKKLNLLLTGLILIFSICCLLTGLNQNIYYLALLFLVFTLINNFFIVYEQLFLIYNKILVLFIINLASLISFYLLYYIYPKLFISGQIAYLITFLAALRILSLAIVKLFTKHHFKI